MPTSHNLSESTSTLKADSLRRRQQGQVAKPFQSKRCNWMTKTHSLLTSRSSKEVWFYSMKSRKKVCSEILYITIFCPFLVELIGGH